jgi:hypothetical protein
LPHRAYPLRNARDALGVGAGLLPREVRLGGEVQLLEHARFPRVHRRGRGRGHVRHREQIQVAQALAPAQVLAELVDGCDVVEVAVRGDVVHEQVVAHEGARLVDVFLHDAEAWQDALAELGPRARVVLSRAGLVGVALAHVVQQRRQKKRHRARDLGSQARGERVLVRELAARELAQAIDGGHGVNVDRVHVVDVVMHAPGDGAELRDHREQQPRVVQVAHDGSARAFHLRHRAHELHEELRGLRSEAELLAPAHVLGGARDDVARERQERRALSHARRESAEGDDRVLPELHEAGDGDVPVEEVDTAAEVDGGARLGAPALRAEPLEEARPRPGDIARAKVERLHHALGGKGAIVAVSHRDGQRLLVVEAEAVCLATRAQVQAVADAPEELLGLVELVRLSGHHHAQLHEAAPWPA